MDANATESMKLRKFKIVLRQGAPEPNQTQADKSADWMRMTTEQAGSVREDRQACGQREA